MVDQAVDFSTRRPTADELLAAGCGALVYHKTWGTQGPAVAYIAELRAAGVEVAGIYEVNTTDAFGGHDAGVAAAQRADSRFEPGTLVYYAVDTSGIGGHETDVADYFDAIADTTREPVIGAYGSQATLDIARTIPKVQRLWGVDGWYPGSRGTNWADHVEVNAAHWRAYGAHLMQVVGDPPIPGTDLNLVFQPNWASIGDATRPEDDMTPEEHADLKFCAEVAQKLHDANFWGPAGDSGRLGLIDGIRQIVAEEVAKLGGVSAASFDPNLIAVKCADEVARRLAG